MDKLCSKCKIEKSLDCFSKANNSRDKLYSWCKICRSIADLNYRTHNKKKLNEKNKTYTTKPENKIKKREYDKIYCKNNRKKKNEQRKLYRLKHGRKNEYNNMMLVPGQKLKHYLRTRINKIITRNQKVGSAVKDLGCSVDFLKQYIETKFYQCPKDYGNLKQGEQMTWENHTVNGWHVDHIIPLVSFDLSNREAFLKACHYTNLQPLWWFENLEKHNKIIEGNNE